MGANYSREGRAERLIAAGRVVLAAFSLFAIWLHPSEPARYARITFTLLSGYLTYAFVLALVTWNLEVIRGRGRVITHVGDLMVFALFMFFTERPISPFFGFFLFALAGATLRWQWRGALWTAVAALAAVIGMSLYPTDLFRAPGFDLDDLIIRVVYLAVVATLLGCLGAYEQKLRTELSRLATWPHTVPGEAPEMAREMLQHTAGILGAPRMVLAWEEDEEPWLYLGLWSDGEFQYTREPPAVFGSLVAEPLASRSFFCQDSSGPSPTVIHSSPDGLQRMQVTPLQSGLQARFAMSSVLSLALCGESVKGYLFALDKPRMTSDDLVLGEIVAHKVLTRLEYFCLLKQLRQTAAAEERVRLARDLHDGLLQALTGAALQLETVHRLSQENPQAARQRLLEVQRLIAAEQKDLRSHIRELKPSSAKLPYMDSPLALRLKELAERIERHWGVRVEMIVKPPEPRILKTLSQEIYFLFHESLINAARHARALTIRAELGVEDSLVRIIIADDGCGFPFRGHYDQATLTEMNVGPATLKERVASLGGSLAIDSSDTGARLEIKLPNNGSGGGDGHSAGVG